MSGNNMESLLMGGDDSSSGDSDDEVNVPMGTTAASAVAAIPSPAAPLPPAPAPAPPPAPSAAPGNMSQLDQMARLKSLYSSQNKRSTTPSSGPGTPQTSNATRPAPVSQPPPMQVNKQSMPQTTSVPSHPRQEPAPRPMSHHPPQQRQQHTSQQRQPSHHSNRHMPSSQPPQAPSSTVDPFAPTPLQHIKERHQQKVDVHQRTMPPQPSTSNSQQPARGSSMPTQAIGRPGSGGDRAAIERELRRQKEKFLMFTRVLIKYLEQKDPTMHHKAKLIIKDCAERNKRQEKGYESVTAAMKERLKTLVGDNYWKRAEAYLKHFLEQKKGSSSSSAPSASRPSNPSAPGASSSSAPSSRQPQQQQRQYMDQEQQRKLVQAKAARAAAKQQQPVASSSVNPSLQNLQREIANQKAKVSSAGTKPTMPTATTTTSGKGASLGKKQVKRKSLTTTPVGRKTSTGTVSQSAAAQQTAATTSAESNVLPPREYNELMELVDHAIDYDWTSAGLLLGSKMDLQLTEEQRNLVYGDNKPTPMRQNDTSGARGGEEGGLGEGPRPGWDKRNVVSSRAAWSRIRLPEQKLSKSSQPVVGDGMLTLPGQQSPRADEPATAWVNEEKAEQDTTLALLSEGCEAYLKGILEKAIHCARQRQNLDGIRLWHQQSVAAANNVEGTENPNKPPLSLRLGCDVSRQVAHAQGNAAMTVKRMEQALERQSGVPSSTRVLTDETLNEATSMADLALRPRVAKGVEAADTAAKRKFEDYGGKNATDPPFGRLPKQTKLQHIDFLMGSNMMECIGRHRAGTASEALYF